MTTSLILSLGIVGMQDPSRALGPAITPAEQAAFDDLCAGGWKLVCVSELQKGDEIRCEDGGTDTITGLYPAGDNVYIRTAKHPQGDVAPGKRMAMIKKTETRP